MKHNAKYTDKNLRALTCYTCSTFYITMPEFFPDLILIKINHQSVVCIGKICLVIFKA